MGVLYDTASEQQRSTSAATATFTHTATASNVVGVLVAFVRGGAATTISNVSYGGTTLVQVLKASDTATEPGAAEWWFASSPPQGAQVVSYNAAATGSNIHAVAITVTGQHPAYVLSSQLEQENTVSSSVSLTTGFVSGIAFGAFYGGGAEPATLTYSVDRTEVHVWDFGAFYSEVFRLTSPTAAGTGPVLDFGASTTTDDVAFAAVFITDGVILPGVGSVTLAGNIPAAEPLGQPGGNAWEPGAWAGGAWADGAWDVAVDEGATALPGAGAVTAQGLAATLAGELLQGAGLGQVTLEGRTASLWTERVITNLPKTWLPEPETPEVGGVLLLGLAPLLQKDIVSPVLSDQYDTLAWIEGREPTILSFVQPEVGALAFGSLAPDVLLSPSISPVAGLISTEGQVPTLVLERAGAIDPGVGLLTTQGLAPSPGSQGITAPEVGLGTVAGPAPPVLSTAMLPATGGLGIAGQIAGLEREKTVTPSMDAATTQGRAPAVSPLITIDAGGITVEGQDLTLNLADQAWEPGAWATGAWAAGAWQARVLGTSIDAGGITIAGQEVATSLDHATTFDAGGLTIAGQTVALSLGENLSLSITAGAVTIAGQTMTASVSVDLELSIEAGAAGIAGQDLKFSWGVPWEIGNLTVTGQDIGIVYTTVISAGAGTASAVGLEPTLIAETVLSPAVGVLVAAGLPPEYFLVSPEVGSLVTSGLAPELVPIYETTAEPEVGSVSTLGHVPLLFRETEAALFPETGALSAVGQVPTLELRETLPVDAGVGEVVIDGLAPTLGGFEKIVEPGVGLVTLAGLPFTAGTFAGKPKKPKRPKTKVVRVEEPELSLGPVPAIALVPVVPAEWTPPVDAMAGMDLERARATLTRLEDVAARRARERREEEELITILLRVA